MESVRRSSSPVLVIVFAAMLLSVVAYVAVGLAITVIPPDALPEPLLYALLVTAVSATIASFVLPRVLRARGDDEAARAGAEVTGRIFAWAMGESIAVFGLVLRIRGFGIDVLLAFAGWSVVVLLLNGPWGRAGRIRSAR